MCSGVVGRKLVLRAVWVLIFALRQRAIINALSRCFCCLVAIRSQLGRPIFKFVALVTKEAVFAPPLLAARRRWPLQSLNRHPQ